MQNTVSLNCITPIVLISLKHSIGKTMAIKVGIIGSGNMGGAIARSLAEESDYMVTIYNRTLDKAVKIAEGRRIKVGSSLNSLANMDVVILAVKPQVLPSIYEDVRNLNAPLYISLLAGVTLSSLEKMLMSRNIVRYMPNIAAGVKSSVTAVTYYETLSDEKKKLALDIASSFGSAFYLNESLFNGFIGISGSAIAFVFEFMHALSLAGVREGIPYSTSLDIVRETLRSAVEEQKSTQKGATELENMVCSAKGTTIEGVKKLKELNFENAVMEAARASAEKARSMEKAN